MNRIRTYVIAAAGIFAVIVYLAGALPAAALEPGAEVYPAKHALDFPDRVTYTNGTPVFNSTNGRLPTSLEGNPPNARWLITLRVFRPDGSEIPGIIRDEQHSTQMTIAFEKNTTEKFSPGVYRARVEWLDGAKPIDEWTFEIVKQKSDAPVKTAATTKSTKPRPTETPVVKKTPGWIWPAAVAIFILTIGAAAVLLLRRKGR